MKGATMHYSVIAAGALQLAAHQSSDRTVKAVIFYAVIAAVVALIVFVVQRASRARVRRAAGDQRQNPARERELKGH
jgi:heme/copper-type cytochrome/quinol oxidase subunit 2